MFANHDIFYISIQDKIVTNKIKFIYVSTKKMVTNSLTKSLTYVKFYGFLNLINMT